MASSFEKLVSLVRKSDSAALLDHVLWLTFHITPGVLEEVVAIAENKAVRTYVDNAEVFDFEHLKDAKVVRCSISGVESHTAFVAQNLEKFLRHQGGIFLSTEHPDEWYLIDEDYWSVEQPSNDLLSAYKRLPGLLSFLKETFDFVAPDGVREKYILLAGSKIEIPISYSARDLARVPSDGALVELRDDIFSPPQVLAKKELFKRAVSRFIGSVDCDDRFVAMLGGFGIIAKSYSADRDNFFSEFQFDKLAEQFERKRQDFMLKIDSVCGDLLTKVLAVPIGQAIVVSQYKSGSEVFGNVALLAGSAIFTAVGMAFVLNQVHSIREVRASARREKDEIEIKYPALNQRVKNTYGSVLRRVNWYGRALPALVIILLAMGFVVSLAAYDRVEPCNGCIRTLIGVH
jgi:hypothetical protein